MAIGLAIFFGFVAVRWYRRREPDVARIIHRLRPRALAGAALRLAPWVKLPVIAGTWLAVEVGRGREGGAAKKQAEDYWRKSLATYRDAPSPSLRRAELHLDLFPERSGYHARATYELVNDLEKPLRQILLTGGPHWEKLAWTRDGAPCRPEDRARLYVFTPAGGVLAPGESTTIGFEHEGTLPPGISRKCASAREFILPSAVVLNSSQLSVVPMLGFFDVIGVDEENRQGAKVYPDDFYEGQTDSFTGAARSPFATRITITGPADFTLNSVGTQVEDSVNDGRRTAVWVSEHPVSFFNVIAGRWAVERGEGTAVFYHPGHPYNVPEMRRALDGARRYYSDWFFAFPWGELKLSEFPNLAGYAEGFPTDIIFSEAGFLTESTPKIHAAFETTAHEAAHQWWGNILVPGKGPGAVVLGEGTSNFSAILVVEQVYGLNARIDFCERLEANYANDRQADSERPLVKLDGYGGRPGDVTAIYDKGGWVFWMLLDHMGRGRALDGMRAFFKEYHGNSDHPVLQDFLAVMRRFAADREALDAFARQWFYRVVVPEYRITSPTTAPKGSSWELTARVENAGTGRMPVEVAAARGERFANDGSPGPKYREVRTTITLDGGEAQDVIIACPFEPDRVVVDPDAKVLQLQRKSAQAKL
jgi:ABC-2 type transport system permease protein